MKQRVTLGIWAETKAALAGAEDYPLTDAGSAGTNGATTQASRARRRFCTSSLLPVN